MKDGHFSLRLRNRKPNQAVVPGPLLQILTPRNTERTRRSSILFPTIVQDPNHPLKPQNQRTTRRSSIMLSSTSQASDHGTPRGSRILTQSMLKSSSTEGLLGWRTGIQTREKGRAIGKRKTERSLSVFLSPSLSHFIVQGWDDPIPDPSILEQLDECLQSGLLQIHYSKQGKAFPLTNPGTTLAEYSQSQFLNGGRAFKED